MLAAKALSAQEKGTLFDPPSLYLSDVNDTPRE
jgi:hypothetical protein